MTFTLAKAFLDLIPTFDEYHKRADAAAPLGTNGDFAAEIREKLKQLAYILERVSQLERDADKAFSRYKLAFEKYAADVHFERISPDTPFTDRMTPEEFEAQADATFEMQMLTECFYYIASRIRSIARHRKALLPGLGAFECEGVRNTRNKLLEHPESDDSLVSIRSFGYGAPIGPVLKAIRWDSQTDVFPDRGLYVNAEEFRGNFERCLNAAIARFARDRLT